MKINQKSVPLGGCTNIPQTTQSYIWNSAKKVHVKCKWIIFPNFRSRQYNSVSSDLFDNFF